MLYWYDTEFIEDGRTIDLVSIGIVAIDDREYYAQSCEFDAEKASQWVIANVFPYLRLCPYIEYDHIGSIASHIAQEMKHHKRGKCIPTMNEPERHRCPWRTRAQIKQEVLEFMGMKGCGKPELWGYYSAYDHVALCQLFGTMMQLPEGWPMYTNDLNQWRIALNVHKLPEQGKGEHNALADARWNRQTYEFLTSASIDNEREFNHWKIMRSIYSQVD